MNHLESCLTNVCHVLSMNKTNKTCMFNLTNVGLNMCAKEYSDLFMNFMNEYEVKGANRGIYGITRMAGKDDNDTHAVEKVWENTRMAGEKF